MFASLVSPHAYNVLFFGNKKWLSLSSYLPGLHQLQLQPPHGSHSTRVDLANKLIHAKSRPWKVRVLMRKYIFNHEPSGNDKRRIGTRYKAVLVVLVGKFTGLSSKAVFT